MTLATDYAKRFRAALQPVARALEVHLSELMQGTPHIDRISARPKTIDSFLGKAGMLTESGEPKYPDPIAQIQDQIGARIIVFYKQDVDAVAARVNRYFRPIESKDRVPESQWRFGYFGKHFILLMPEDVVDAAEDRQAVPPFFELQVKTLFQHAWSEGSHDLGYKPGEVPLEPDDERMLAYTSAQAWGADRAFDELFSRRAERKRAIDASTG